MCFSTPSGVISPRGEPQNTELAKRIPLTKRATLGPFRVITQLWAVDQGAVVLQQRKPSVGRIVSDVARDKSVPQVRPSSGESNEPPRTT